MPPFGGSATPLFKSVHTGVDSTFLRVDQLEGSVDSSGDSTTNRVSA